MVCGLECDLLLPLSVNRFIKYATVNSGRESASVRKGGPFDDFVVNEILLGRGVQTS